MDFEKEMTEAIQKRMLQQIKEIDFIDRWKTGKMVIPSDIIERAWLLMDWDKIIVGVSEQLQNQAIKSIVGNMLTEAGTDVKKLLSVEGVRQKIKMQAYPKIMEIINESK